MKYLTRMLALTRLLALRRQWKTILGLLQALPHDRRATLAALVYGEAQRAAKHPLPQFYASTPTEAYRPWGDAVDVAFSRIQSDNPQLQLRGIATWLAVVFHETRSSSVVGLQELHRQVARSLDQHRALHERVLAIRMAA